MSANLILVLFVIAFVIVYMVVSYIGNKIVDKGSDTIENAYRRRKNQEHKDESERLSDRYQK